MAYIDGFVTPIPSSNKEAYREHAERMWGWLRERGALGVVEAWGDDVPEGKVTSFPMAVKLEPGETVLLSWITWPDKATRDSAYASMDMAAMGRDMPFDGRRMIYGGFVPLFQA